MTGWCCSCLQLTLLFATACLRLAASMSAVMSAWSFLYLAQITGLAHIDFHDGGLEGFGEERTITISVERFVWRPRALGMALRRPKEVRASVRVCACPCVCCLCLSLCLSVRLSVSQSVSQSVFLCDTHRHTVYVSVSLSVSQSVGRPASQSVCQSVCLSVCLPVRLSACLPVCLSLFSSANEGAAPFLWYFHPSRPPPCASLTAGRPGPPARRRVHCRRGPRHQVCLPRPRATTGRRFRRVHQQRIGPARAAPVCWWAARERVRGRARTS